MKKIIYSFVCAALLGLTSCNDFLEEDSREKLTSGDYFKTESQATANVNRLYWMGVPRHYAEASSAYLGPDVTIPGMLTGYFINSYEGQELVCQYARLLTRQQYPSNMVATVQGIWDPCYQAINVANASILYTPDINMDADDRARLVAEAKFFRAFNYFYLVKTFGAVPMPTIPYESYDQDLRLPRTDVSTVYELIESDLIAAVEVLPAVMFSNGHRITKFAAAMLLANVYFQQGKYSEAVPYAKIVIDSPHSLTTNDDLQLNSAFNKLRTTEDLAESIYAVEFDNNIRNGSWWPTYAFTSAATAVFGTYSIFERVYGPTDRFLNVYDSTDLRIQPNQFFHWEYTNPNNGVTWRSDQAGCWYYYDEDALLNTGRATKDWNIFRYAEALLVAAESIAQSNGVTAEAVGYLAEIKARADMNGKTSAQYAAELQNMSPTAFIEECWIERLREFPLEFKIWDDCTRTGMFPSISETENGKVNFVPLIGAKNGSGATFTQSDLLWPISEEEIQRNPNLTQNPGYER